MSAWKVLGGLVGSIVVIAAATGALVSLTPDPIRLDLGDLPRSAEPRGAEFQDFRKITTYVRAPDGAKLAVDVFLPSDPIDNTQTRRFPTIFRYTPYSRSYAVLDLGWIERFALRFERGVWGPVVDASTMRNVEFLLSRGYAYAVADMRGTGASDGRVMQLDPAHGPDGAAIIDWIAEQDWSDGQVCMHGQSYSGWVQFAVAAERPEALRCIAPSQVFFESYTGSSRPGGVAALSWLQRYSDYLEGFTDNDRSRGYVTAPVIDEDGDGVLIDEIPVNLGEAEAPRYRDHDSREQHHYLTATTEHAANLQPGQMTDPRYDFIDDPIVFDGRRSSYPNSSPGVLLARGFLDSDIAVLNIAGWFDGFGRGAFKTYATLADHRENRLFAAPRFHVPHELTPAYREWLGYSGSYYDQLVFEELRFFDTHLRGLDAGLAAEPPVKLYVINDGWRTFEAWPPDHSTMTGFFLSQDGALAAAPDEHEGVDVYHVDWRHTSNYGQNASNRWLMMEAPEGLMMRTQHDQQALVYETAPLDEDVDVIGHPEADLRLSSDRPDADVFVYLSEVAPDGTAYYVSEARLRLGFANARADDDAQALDLVDVSPDLPWHDFSRAGYDPEALAGQHIVEARFDLFPVAWRFRAGHRIRISITGADAGNFELNPVACPGGEPATCPDTVLRAHRGGDSASAIRLPVATRAGGDQSEETAR